VVVEENAVTGEGQPLLIYADSPRTGTKA
jgi:hypothetical protein